MIMTIATNFYIKINKLHLCGALPTKSRFSKVGYQSLTAKDDEFHYSVEHYLIEYSDELKELALKLNPK